MTALHHWLDESRALRLAPRVVGLSVLLFAAGVVLVSLHYGGLRERLAERVRTLQEAQSVQRLLLGADPSGDLGAAVAGLEEAIAALGSPGPGVLAARDGIARLREVEPGEGGGAVDALVHALREESAEISRRLGSLWTWLAVGAVASLVLAALAWVLSMGLVRSRERARVLLATLQAEAAERRRAEAERGQRERLLEQLVEHAPVGIAIYAADGALVRRNHEHARLYPDPPPAPASVKGPADRAVGKAVVEQIAAEVPAADGSVEATVVFAADVTDARRRQQRMWAEDRASTVASLARGMGHEIRNPLTFVLGNVDWLLDEVRTNAAMVPEATRATWEQALADVAQGLRRLRGTATDLGALAGHSGDESCDAAEALRLAVRLMATELTDFRAVEVAAASCVVRGGSSQHSLLLADVLRGVVRVVRAVRRSPWHLRVALAPTAAGGACIQIDATAPEGDDPTTERDGVDLLEQGAWAASASLLAAHGGALATERAERGFRVALELAAPDGAGEEVGAAL